MAEHGQDDEASAIICAATARLHQGRKHQLPELLHWRTGLTQSWSDRARV
ncbi:hypothetical protein GFL24_36415, partial [Rhizobium laguerreae]|nr:hypothetical protein [Rhizobium laguerreae]